MITRPEENVNPQTEIFSKKFFGAFSALGMMLHKTTGGQVCLVLPEPISPRKAQLPPGEKLPNPDGYAEKRREILKKIPFCELSTAWSTPETLGIKVVDILSALWRKQRKPQKIHVFPSLFCGKTCGYCG